jgi:hypothetical protein
MCEYLAAESRTLGRPKPPVAISTASKWENGHCWPDAWHAYCLCSLLNLAPEALALQTVLSAAELATMHRIARVAADGTDRSPMSPEATRLTSVLYALKDLVSELQDQLQTMTVQQIAPEVPGDQVS